MSGSDTREVASYLARGDDSTEAGYRQGFFFAFAEEGTSMFECVTSETHRLRCANAQLSVVPAIRKTVLECAMDD